MRFFTPELYETYATAKPEAGNAAEAKWDAAEEKYERRLNKLRPSLPSQVLLLANKLCLHDADVLNLVCSHENADLWLHKDGVFFLLNYHLRAIVEVSAGRRSKVFADEQARWLYDEIDMPRKGIFSHEVLLGDGRTMRIVFDRCSVHEIHPVGTAARLDAASKRTNGRESGPLQHPRRSLPDVSAGCSQHVAGVVASLRKRK